MFDMLLLSVVVSTAYLGLMVFRRLGPHQRVFGLMLVADLVLALLTLADRSIHGGSQASNSVGAVAIGAGFCLVVLPSWLRDLGKWLMAKDRLALAKRVAGLRELLQPGMGAGAEIELMETMLAVLEGREQSIIDGLEAVKRSIDEPIGRCVLDERIVMIYLYAQRWDAAILAYEGIRIGDRMHGLPAYARREPLILPYEGIVDDPSDYLGSPQLSVEMVRAYCEEGNLERAALQIMRIETLPIMKSEPSLIVLLARARMVFLSFAGRTQVVEALIAPEGGPLAHISEAACSYWRGIAKLNAGDGSGARSSLSEAIRLSGGDRRASTLAQAHLERAQDKSQLGPHSHPQIVSELADTLTTHVASEARAQAARPDEGVDKRLQPRLSGVPMREMPVTTFMAVANIAVSLAVYLSYGSINDLGSLIAVGANLKSATLGGEWWRVGTSMFLHVGVAHLLLNVYGLWVLGRLVEQMQGSVRTLVIYVVAGVAGGLASTYLGGPTTSLGASGAVVGLMGAAVIELGVYRKRYPAGWARHLLRLLLMLSGAQLLIGFLYPMVDQWGHVGGFLGGALAGMLLSRSGVVLRKLRSTLAYALAFAALAALLLSGLGRATTDYSGTLRSYSRLQRTVGGVIIDAPSAWGEVDTNELYDPGIGALLDLRRVPAVLGLDEVIEGRLVAEEREGASEAGFSHARRAESMHFHLPDPWRGGELEVLADGDAGEQRYLLLVFGRVIGDDIVLGSYYLPAALSVAIEPVFLDILRTIRLAGWQAP